MIKLNYTSMTVEELKTVIDECEAELTAMRSICAPESMCNTCEYIGKCARIENGVVTKCDVYKGNGEIHICEDCVKHDTDRCNITLIKTKGVNVLECANFVKFTSAEENPYV